MGNWLRISDELAVNLSQVTHVEFDHDDDGVPVAFLWLGYTVPEQGEQGEPDAMPDCIYLIGNEATSLKNYMMHNVFDVNPTYP